MLYLCFGAAADLLSPYWNNSVSAELVHGMNVTGRIKTDLKKLPFFSGKNFYNIICNPLYETYINDIFIFNTKAA